MNGKVNELNIFPSSRQASLDLLCKIHFYMLLEHIYVCPPYNDTNLPTTLF